MQNLQPYFFKIKKYQKLILTLGFLYGSAIVFPDFGPILLRVVDGRQAIFMGILAMLFLALSICPKIGALSEIELNKKYLLTLGNIALILAGIFKVVPTIYKFIFLGIFMFTIGRITVFWSKSFLENVPPHSRGLVIGTSLFIAYGLLYSCNATVPSLPPFLVTVIAGLLLFISIRFYYSFSNKLSGSIKEIPCSTALPAPLKIYFLFLCVYITAGFTYVEVYPHFSNYIVERYYNVLPFVFSAFIAGIIADNKGRKYLLYIGIALLGLSFTLYSFPRNILIYFITQSLLQSGWAFLDVFIWVIAADVAVQKNNFYYFTYGIASMVGGVSIGAFLSLVLRQYNNFQSITISIIAYLPLFIAVALLGFIPETLKKGPDLSEPIQFEELDVPIIKELTPREKEITVLLYRKLSNKNICELLCISNNTLKTHLRNIYRKTGVSNRKELRNLLTDLLN